MSQNRAIVDKLLTNVSSAYVPKGYISEKLLPQIKVVQTTGKLGKYTGQHLRIETSIIGGEGQYRRVKAVARSTSSYEIESHGLEGVVTKNDRRNVELPFEAESDEVMGLSTKLWLEKEYSLATVLANASVVTQGVTLSGTSKFSDYANSTPLTVAATARAAIRNACGQAPDTFFCDWAVAEKLAYHPQLMEYLGFTQARPGGLTHQELAKALGVRRIEVADVVYNSAKEGQTDSLAAVWGKLCWFAVLPETAQKQQVSAGYRVGYGSTPRKVYKYPINNPPESTGILVEDEYQMLISNVNAIYRITDAIA